MNFKSPFWISVLSLALLFPIGLKAQSGLDTSNIPTNAIGAFVFSLSKIKANPKLEDLPYEVIANEFETNIGLDIFTIKQGTVIVYPGKDSTSMPEFAIVLKLTQKPALDGREVRDLEDQAGYKTKGVPYMPASVLVIDDTTLLVLRDGSDAEKFVNPQAGALAKIAEKVASDDWNAFAVLDSPGLLAAYGDTIKEGAKQIPFLPPPVAQLIPLLDELKAAQVVLAVEPYKFEARLRFSDTATAAKASKKIKDAAEFGAQMGVGVLAAQMDPEDPTQAAGLEYFQRLIKEVPELPNFQLNGNELTLTLKDEEFLLPAFALGMATGGSNFSLPRARRSSAQAAAGGVMPLSPEMHIESVEALEMIGEESITEELGGPEAADLMRDKAWPLIESVTGDDAKEALGNNAPQTEEAKRIRKRLKEKGIDSVEGLPLESQKRLLEDFESLKQ